MGVASHHFASSLRMPPARRKISDGLAAFFMSRSYFLAGMGTGTSSDMGQR